MKKLFTYILSVCVVTLALPIGLQANEFIVGQKIKEQISNTVKAAVEDNDKRSGDFDEVSNNEDFIKVISFIQDIVTKSGKPQKPEQKECIAIVIDDAWAVASKKCLLSEGDPLLPSAGEVRDATARGFQIFLNGSWNNVKEYYTKNLFLFKAVNENGYPLFAANPKARLTYTSAKNKEQFDDSFADGTFEVNITKNSTSAYDSAHASYEDNFHSYYGVKRNTRTSKIKSINKDKNNVLATIKIGRLNWKELRAGDPLFYVENGQRYLLGFPNAVNLLDNFKRDNDHIRTDEVILFTYSDTRGIWETIKSVDPEAAARIEKRILAK